jgi:Predicted phosphatase homologous to the C-terminal domain of histone macroH2A1
MQFEVIQGDIAAQSADALVNAAGTSLRMGSGVAGALRRGAGSAINQEAVSKGPVELGEVAVTDAYDLGAESLVIPALGCGVAGFELEEGARVICEVIDGYDPETLADVRFIAYADAEYETMREVAEEVRSG